MKNALWKVMLCVLICFMLYACVTFYRRTFCASKWSTNSLIRFELTVEGKVIGDKQPAYWDSENQYVMLPFLPIATSLGCCPVAHTKDQVVIEYSGEQYVLDTQAGTLTKKVKESLLPNASSTSIPDFFRFIMGIEHPKVYFMHNDTFYIDSDSAKAFIVSVLRCKMEISYNTKTVLIYKRS